MQFINPSTSFDDVAGLKENKNALRQIASSIRGFNKKTEVDLKSTSSNILFYGPPGTGKSLLAAAMAKECGAQFVSIDSGYLILGCTAWSNMSNTDRVEALFSEAAKNAPSVIFLDGIDNIFPQSPEWTPPAFLKLLKELDKPRNQVIVIASATKPEIISWSLFRRFSYTMKFTLPDDDTRRQIISALLKQFGAHAEKPNMVEIEDRTSIIDMLVKETEGFSGEEIQDVYVRTLCNLIQYAVVNQDEKITLKTYNFQVAIEEFKQERKKK
jgi:transitional endoplasmic reticulum ATPase